MTVPRRAASDVRAALRALERAYRDDVWHWMPDLARPIEVIVGAILVQHTTWTNAERALAALRAAGALDALTLASMPDAEIAALVRVSGTPSVKARRLRAVATTIEHAGGIGPFLALSFASMRPLLLTTHGVGPETADAIALYAAGQRTFVIDAYTRRVFSRLGLEPRARPDTMRGSGSSKGLCRGTMRRRSSDTTATSSSTPRNCAAPTQDARAAHSSRAAHTAARLSRLRTRLAACEPVVLRVRASARPRRPGARRVRMRQRVREQSIADADTHVYVSANEYVDTHPHADRDSNSNGHAYTRVAGQP